jgi:hypothetical protein
MMKNPKSDSVGDQKTPALQATESGLRTATDQAGGIAAENPGPAQRVSTLQNIAISLKNRHDQNGSPGTCTQILWLSFFFDGTGNNLDADLGLSKHSSIARLYRAHAPKNDNKGILVVYIPGIGTYFPEKGDDGGSALGLGCGRMGDRRLEFALERLDSFLAKPLALAKAPSNTIKEINIAVFGFSRGAALSRAFVNTVMAERCLLRNGRWILKEGRWPVRFRFLGLFDTVASVGLPMSSGTTGVYEAANGDTAGLMAKRRRNYQATRPEELAYAISALPGADPAWGNSHGHDDWGERLRVHETIEEVRHFVAAHEIRNSFPVDSISVIEKGRIIKPAHFHEVVYPGAHSDVGGGYAPGEGARGITPPENLSLIPLRHMYEHAVRHGVPMLAEWQKDNSSDFETDPVMCAAYNSYLKAVGSFATLGEGINKHMALYYSWRLRAIKRKFAGDKTEAKLIEFHDRKFREQDGALTREVDNLSKKEKLAQLSLNASMTLQDMQASASNDSAKQPTVSEANGVVESARENYQASRRAYLKAKARKDSLPNLNKLQALVELYDRELLADIRAIRPALPGPRNNRKMEELRPHYKALLEAYENEFERNNGLKDEQVLSFFDNYVHDSLAGFGKDATLPSDPRVVYMGDDQKYKYASLDNENLSSESVTRKA